MVFCPRLVAAQADESTQTCFTKRRLLSYLIGSGSTAGSTDQGSRFSIFSKRCLTKCRSLGEKDYYIRDNTVARHTRLGEALDFSLIKAERSPLAAARLLAGDWLYIPRRFWHLVKCIEDSLSISVGVMSPEAFLSARRIPAGWIGSSIAGELQIPTLTIQRRDTTFAIPSASPVAHQRNGT